MMVLVVVALVLVLVVLMVKMTRFTHTLRVMSWDGSVGVEIGYGLEDRMIGFRYPVGAGNFSHRHHVQTGSWAHRMGSPSLRVKRLGRKAGYLHLVPRSKKAWNCTSSPQYVFMVWCIVEHRDNVTFIFYYQNVTLCPRPVLSPTYRISK
jgi:hypothetical protein